MGTTRVSRANAIVVPPTVLTKTTVVGLGDYAEIPFTVPAGVTRIDAALSKSSAQANLGFGVFDERGPGYQSPGFRGIYGQENNTFFISTSSASRSFVPGPINAGTWTILIPVFQCPVPTQVTVTITMSYADQGSAFQPGPQPGVVVDAPGWYRGDLHCHTPESSDACASGSAMTPAQWADAARAIGMDFLSMTDHNVISQNFFLERDSGSDMLLMAGEEMTNWFHGHATVSGIDVGHWLDFRQSPLGAPLPTGTNGARISDFIRAAESMGAYVAAAHPAAAQLAWQFQADAEADPASRTHGYEVWTSGWQPDDEVALSNWDAMLVNGWGTVANGGSDLHGVVNSNHWGIGMPTTVVYAQRLARAEIIAAVKAGRSFITHDPSGVEVYLTATAPGQETYVGGKVYGGVGDTVTTQVRVRRAGGMRLVLVSGGLTLDTVAITSDDQTFTFPVRIPIGGGYVRAEVRSTPVINPGNITSSTLDMMAFTNPVWLVEGSIPAGYVAEHAPVPPTPGPRRITPRSSPTPVTSPTPPPVTTPPPSAGTPAPKKRSRVSITPHSEALAVGTRSRITVAVSPLGAATGSLTVTVSGAGVRINRTVTLRAAAHGRYSFYVRPRRVGAMHVSVRFHGNAALMASGGRHNYDVGRG